MFRHPIGPATPLSTALAYDGTPSLARFVVAEDWSQGRTAFGGLPVAIAFRAMEALVNVPGGETRSIASLTAQFIEPVPVGEAELYARVLRTGRSMTHAGAEVWVGDQLAITVQAAFATPRPSRLNVTPAAAPLFPPPESLPAMPYLPGQMPAFTQHFSYRQTSKSWAFQGAKNAELGGWTRTTEEHPLDPATILMMLDAWPAAALCLANGITPASTVSWMVTFFDQPKTEAGPWTATTRHTTASANGLSDETAAIWDMFGRCLARSRQLCAVFG